MSEWLTTGEMIDRLKVGEVAESDRGYHVKKTVDDEIVFSDKTGENAGSYFHTRAKQVDSKWRILPKYVTFEEAMKALRSGKTVVYKGDEGNSWNHKMTPKQFETFGLGGTEFKHTGLRHMLDGKWQIIE